MLDSKIEEQAKQWLGPEFDPETREEIRALFERRAWEELTDRFYTELEFGTGGMRGVIGPGTNRMNVYIVRMSTQGLANYILSQGFDHPAAVIAHDSRRQSDRFALETALVLAGNGIKAYLFPELRPTPELSFAVRHLGASAGVVITASHNPPEYNGYKVYWEDGGQVVPPHDQGIIREVRQVKSVREVRRLDREQAERQGLLEWLNQRVDHAFLEAVGRQVVDPELVRQEGDRLGVVYTPLHGTGVTMVPPALERMGLKRVEVLESQGQPDPEFSTVRVPNPEEREALSLAIERAQASGAELVLATDPDCDRVGIAYRARDGRFILPNGNQIGSMMCHYLLERLSQRGTMPARPVIVKTIVTTELQRAIAESYGAEVIDTLTGFKYIGEQIRLMEERQDGRRFVFGGEESYGYLVGTHARDKDAVVSSQLIAEVAAWCGSQGQTLGDYLDRLFARYGVYLESLRSLTRKGQRGGEEIGALMASFRRRSPERIAGARVTGVWDLQSGERRDLAAGRVERTALPSSNVLQFFLEDGSRVTMRPSGTEPKVKFYFGVRRPPNPEADVQAEKQAAGERLKALEEGFMQQVEESLAALGG